MMLIYFVILCIIAVACEIVFARRKITIQYEKIEASGDH